MEIGEANKNNQELVRKTDIKSTTHQYAKIWVMRCRHCDYEYGSNSCDAHIYFSTWFGVRFSKINR